MDEAQIAAFWEAHPCGELQVGGLDRFKEDYEGFFAAYDARRYDRAPHIPTCLDNIDFSGKRVLEIGLGQGADSEQIIRRGGIWSGIDLTEESVDRVRTRFAVRGLAHDQLVVGTVLDLPFADQSFDIVFSHGVLHHVPDIAGAQREIHRVLKPDGRAVVMLYARWSLNYVFSIAFARRLGLLAMMALGLRPRGILGQHAELARAQGLRSYLRLSNFVHRNTDGPYNPYSRVYDRGRVEMDFVDFEIETVFKRYMHAPPLPVRWLPLERLLGWHLWVHLKPRMA